MINPVEQKPRGERQRSDERELGYDQCYGILREHGKTFYVMAKLFGPARGRALAAVYGFCRVSDDIVDASKDAPPVVRERLAGILAELRSAARSESGNPRFSALGETIRKYGIDLHPFEDLLAGVAMDLEKNRYEDFAELDLYCYRVAGTVGLMLLPIAGFDGGAATAELAKTLGKAFQLTNILRDVGADLELGRIYLPRQELQRFGLSEQDIRDHLMDGRFKEFMDFQIDRAFTMYRQGLELIPFVRAWGGRLAFQFAADAYSSIMKKIRKNGYDVYGKRAHLTAAEKILLVPLSFFRVLAAVARHKCSRILKERKSVQPRS